MLRRWTLMAALAAVLCTWSSAYSAVIVTTLGEEIVCEIVEESDTYFIVNHDGYRRYVLKTQVRSLDRSDGPRLNAQPRRYATLFSNYYITGHRIKPGPRTFRFAVGYPINALMLVEGGLHYGKSRVDSEYDTARMLSGPFGLPAKVVIWILCVL